MTLQTIKSKCKLDKWRAMLTSKMIEFVGSCNNLSWDWNDFIRIVLMADLGIDGSVETVDKSCVFSSSTSCLYSSAKHCNKKIRTLLWRRNIWIFNIISNDQKYTFFMENAFRPEDLHSLLHSITKGLSLIFIDCSY